MSLPARFMTADRVLRGPHLYLRPLTLDDASERYVAWLNDPEVNRYSGRLGQTFSISDVRQYISECAASDDRMLFGMFDAASDVHFGNVLLSDIDTADRSGEVSNLIGDRVQMPRGGALEANRLLIDFAFSSLKLERLSIGNVRGHRAASFLTRQLGFELASVETGAIIINDTAFDRLRFALTRQQFYAKFPPT